MAGHTRLGRGKTRKPGVLYAGVTIATVDSVVLDMVLVAEHNRLLRRDFYTRHPRSAIRDVPHRERGSR